MNEILHDLNKGFEQKNSSLIYQKILELFQKNNSFFFQKHPLGFNFLNLGKLSDAVEFRLHVWDSRFGSNDNELQIHNHSFDFESFVVSGKIKNTIFRLIKNEGSNGVLYEVKFIDNKSILDVVGENCDIKADSVTFIDEGYFYDLSKDKFHKSEHLVDFSITLLKMIKPTVFNPPLIFSSKRIKELKSFSRSQLKEERNNEIITRVKKICENILL
jgi:hypothetical protein